MDSGIVDGGEKATSDATSVEMTELTKLEAQLKALQEQKKMLQSSRDEVKKKYTARVDKEANVRLGKSDRNPNEDLHKLCRIFGLEVVARVENDYSIMLHHWENGECIGNSSVAIEASSKTADRFAVTSYNIPSHAVEWLNKAPCSIPTKMNLQEAVRDINSSCIAYFSRKQQLRKFQEQFPEVDVLFNNNLTRIILETSLKDNRSGRPTSFILELVYSPFKLIYPSDINISMKSKSKTISEESAEEMVELLREQIMPFQSMDILDAYCFCFKFQDESTRRTFTSITVG